MQYKCNSPFFATDVLYTEDAFLMHLQCAKFNFSRVPAGCAAERHRSAYFTALM